MGHSPFQEANSSSAGQEILRILLHLNGIAVYIRTH